ncbi:hypothetical protein Ancab_024325 [Ancistrocladus abbreviatus]
MATEPAADQPVTAPPQAHELVEGKPDEAKWAEIESKLEVVEMPKKAKETEEVKMPTAEESSKPQEIPEQKQSEPAEVEEKSDKSIVDAGIDAPEEAPSHGPPVSEEVEEQGEPESAKENGETAGNATVELAPEGSNCVVGEQPTNWSAEKQPEEQLPKVEAAGEKLKEAVKSMTDVPEASVELTKKQEEILETSAVKEPEAEVVKEAEACQEKPAVAEKMKEQIEAPEVADVVKSEVALEASAAEVPQSEMGKEKEASQVKAVEEEKAKEQPEAREATQKPEEILEASGVREDKPQVIKERDVPQMELTEKEKPKEQLEATEIVDVPESSAEIAKKPEEASDTASVVEPEKEEVKEREDPQLEYKGDKKTKDLSAAIEVVNVVDSSTEANPGKEPEQEVQEKEIPQAESVEAVGLKSTPLVEENPEEQSEPAMIISMVKSSLEAIERPEEIPESNPVKDQDQDQDEVVEKLILQEPKVDAVGSSLEAEKKQKETSDANAVKEPEQEVVKEREILQAEPVEEIKQEAPSQVEEKLELQYQPTKVSEVAELAPEAAEKPEEILGGNQEKEPEQDGVKEFETSQAERANEEKVESPAEVEEKPNKVVEATETIQVPAEASETLIETIEAHPSKELEQAVGRDKKEQEEAPHKENIPKELSEVTEVVDKECEKVEPREIQADGIESVASDGKEKSNESHEPPVCESSENVATIEKVALAEQKEYGGQHLPADVAEQTSLETDEKEVSPAKQVQEIVEDVLRGVGEVEDRHEAEDVKNKEEKLEKNPTIDGSAKRAAEKPKDESIPIPTEEVTKSTLRDIISRDVEVNPENKEEDMEEKTLASVETDKLSTHGEKLTGVVANEEAELEATGDKTADFDTIKDKDVREVQNLEPDTKDVNNAKESQDQPKEEVPAKKHSNNILSKVKQSLVKAKKAITGKSPQPKTRSSETKDDIKDK